MYAKILTPAMVMFFSLLFSSAVSANACSREEIDFYLQRGFSHEQVVRLCSNTPVMGQDNKSPQTPYTQENTKKTEASDAKTIPAAEPVVPETKTAPPVQPVPGTPRHDVSQNDIIYFKTAIQSDQVDVTPDALTYLLKGCIKYGEPDFNGFKEEACVKTRTTIRRKGLQVIKAQKEIFLIRDHALIVAGDIKREVLDLDKLKEKKRKAFLAEYELNPAQVNIPVRSGIDPRDVAARLQLIAK